MANLKTVTPKYDCGICKGFGTVGGDFVPVPFGSGSCRMPDDYCDCVLDQMSDDDESDIELKIDAGLMAAHEAALKAESEFFAGFDNSED